MKPILFNTEMVRAILERRKTVTRRVVKPQPICYRLNSTCGPHADDFFLSKEKNWLRCRVCGHDPEYSREGSSVTHHWIPPYRPGDILYVRETFFKDVGRYMYKANYFDGEKFYRNGKEVPIKWTPSIHMPREAARIFLRVTDVRVERVQDITDEQAISEGCNGVFIGNGETLGSGWEITPKEEFYKSWDSTIKPKDRARYGWEANPWVWAIEFERREKP